MEERYLVTTNTGRWIMYIGSNPLIVSLCKMYEQVGNTRTYIYHVNVSRRIIMKHLHSLLGRRIGCGAVFGLYRTINPTPKIRSKRKDRVVQKTGRIFRSTTPTIIHLSPDATPDFGEETWRHRWVQQIWYAPWKVSDVIQEESRCLRSINTEESHTL